MPSAPVVEQQDLSEAIERVVAGLEKKSRVLQDDEKKVVAYHEVGHAIVGHLMPGGSKVAKISIVPRGMSALGYTLQLPTEERFLNSEGGTARSDRHTARWPIRGGDRLRQDHHGCGQ